MDACENSTLFHLTGRSQSHSQMILITSVPSRVIRFVKERFNIRRTILTVPCIYCLRPFSRITDYHCLRNVRPLQRRKDALLVNKRRGNRENTRCSSTYLAVLRSFSACSGFARLSTLRNSATR